MLYLRLLEQQIQLVEATYDLSYPGLFMLASPADRGIKYLAVDAVRLDSKEIPAVQSLELDDDGLVDRL